MAPAWGFEEPFGEPDPGAVGMGVGVSEERTTGVKRVSSYLSINPHSAREYQRSGRHARIHGIIKVDEEVVGRIARPCSKGVCAVR